MRKNILQMLSLTMAVALIACLMTGCGGASNATASDKMQAAVATTAAAAMGGVYNYSADMDMVTETTTESGSIFVPADQRKIVRNASLRLHTEDYAGSFELIKGKIAECGGYIERIDTSGSAEHYSRYANMTIRIPADKLDAFLDSRDDFGSVRDVEIWQDDVTFSYTDMETRLGTLETKRDRLMAMLEEAKEMSDIIEIENALSETVYEIERYTSSLRVLQDQVSYSTVNLTLNEVVEVEDLPSTPKTLGEKMAARFGESIEGLGEFGEELLIFVVGASPVIVVLAVIAGVVVLIVKAATKKNKESYEKYKAQYKKDAPEDNGNQ